MDGGRHYNVEKARRVRAEKREDPMNAKKLLDWTLPPPDSAPRSTILIRCMAGGVFLWEGILKFVYVNQGVGRFTKLGIPAPVPMADFVAVLEIVGGLLLISGLLTRLISIPFIIEMIVAMLSTKMALYLGTSPLPLPPSPPQIGIWAVLHEIRSEYAQIMSVLFLLVAGPGPWSLDAILVRRRIRRQPMSIRRELSTVARRQYAET
jgi:putative oxidoreductase